MKRKFAENAVIFVDNLFEDCWDTWREEQKGKRKETPTSTSRTTRKRGKRGTEGEEVWDWADEKNWISQPGEVSLFFLFFFFFFFFFFVLFCFVLFCFLDALLNFSSQVTPLPLLVDIFPAYLYSWMAQLSNRVLFFEKSLQFSPRTIACAIFYIVFGEKYGDNLSFSFLSGNHINFFSFPPLKSS